jgi:hypothetical protein
VPDASRRRPGSEARRRLRAGGEENEPAATLQEAAAADGDGAPPVRRQTYGRALAEADRTAVTHAPEVRRVLRPPGLRTLLKEHGAAVGRDPDRECPVEIREIALLLVSEELPSGFAPRAAVGEEHPAVPEDITEREVARHAQEQPLTPGEGHRVQLLERAH